MRFCKQAAQVAMTLAVAGSAWMPVATTTALASPRQDNPALVTEVIKKLNSHATVSGAESAKSYKTLFGAYLELKKPPLEIGPEFNLNTIHPKMSQWDLVTGWAESNPKMAEAIIKCKDPKFSKVGLPYGRAGLDPAYVRESILADIGIDGSLRNNQFLYLKAVDTIAAFATAEIYRLMEANQAQKALDLSVALAFVVRQFCDREFLAEKAHFVDMLSDVMENLRDVMYLYPDRITAEQFNRISQEELPFLRPDRSRLFLPEADRVVAEALIREVFDERSEQVNAEKFASTFAEVQAQDAPLTIFGAAKRWQMIANVHAPLGDSITRLNRIYDDWWRRWRIDLYDEQLLSVATQFQRTNRVRYAAVVYSLGNLIDVFSMRNTLVADVNGTAMAAALCAYKKTYGTYPDDAEKLYGQSARKRSDSDPYDKELRPFKYRLLTANQAVDVEGDRISIEAQQALLYSVGQDHEDGRAANHSDNGVTGDIILWPALRVLRREAGQVP